MATIDKLGTTLKITAGGDPMELPLPFVGHITLPGLHPSLDPVAGPPAGFDFRSPTIDANGSIRLRGSAGESVAGWTLGFIQLKSRRGTGVSNMERSP